MLGCPLDQAFGRGALLVGESMLLMPKSARLGVERERIEMPEQLAHVVGSEPAYPFQFQKHLEGAVSRGSRRFQRVVVDLATDPTFSKTLYIACAVSARDMVGGQAP